MLQVREQSLFSVPFASSCVKKSTSILKRRPRLEAKASGVPWFGGSPKTRGPEIMGPQTGY